MKMYVIGNQDCVLGFSLTGVEGRIARSSTELEAALDACLADETAGLVLVTADVAQLARERMDQLKVSSLTPLVIEIPGAGGGPALPSLREFVQRAVGISLGGD